METSVAVGGEVEEGDARTIAKIKGRKNLIVCAPLKPAD
jgi:hypothetical protein